MRKGRREAMVHGKGAMAGEIIGRREEQSALEAFLENAPDGTQALLLEGDAGIGKSALWHEGLRLAGERGFRLLTARAAASETRIAFATLGDLLAPVLEATLPRLVPVQRRALETALLLREPDGSPPEVRALGLALVSAVSAVAEDAPVLVALDDLQWVDASSAEILGFMLRRLEGRPVAMLATVRGRPAQAPLDLDRAFAVFARLPLEPLSVGAIHRLLFERLSLNLPRPSLVRVYEATGGNPFYALELGRALIDGTIREGDGVIALPESLESVVADRLARLPGRTHETLVAVAALAAPTVPMVGGLSVHAVDDIERARTLGVLELDRDRIYFTHPLLAPACYSRMPLHLRRSLHRRLADLDVDLEERARHLAIAASGADGDVATVLDEGAAHARARGAALAAAELAELAVALTPADAIEAANRRRIRAADHCMYAGDTSGASRLLEAAVGSSEPGALRAEALSRLAWVRSETDGFRAAETLWNRALVEPGLALRERIVILCRLAWAAAAGGGGPDGIRYAEAALTLAEQDADREQLAFSLATLGELTFWRTGRIRRDLLDQAIEAGRAVGDDGPGRAALARLLARADRYEEARGLWTELVAEAASRADPAQIGYLMFRARMEVASGEWDVAEELCEQGIELARQNARWMGESLCVMVRAEIGAYRGEVDRARTEIPELLRAAGGVGYLGAIHRLTRALASLELSCGDAAAAWRHTAPLFADVAELDEVLGQVAGSVGIEALVEIGDLPGAERLLALLDERAGESDTALRPLADRCRGLLLAAHGRHGAAIEALETATEEPEPPQGVNPLELARTLLALGTLQRRAQHKRAARQSLERAAEIFERLGASLWLENARSEVRRIGGRTASEAELSETERRIVELVVAGRRNREVAVELSLSANTVAWNLSKVYRKLGVSSRTELAARMSAETRV
jgi:DNA-binding CsgD family transcriptional regulator